MTKFSKFAWLFIALGVLVSACGKDDDPKPETSSTNYKPVLEAYVNKTIIPTYKDMKDNSMLLLDNVKKFQTSGAQADLDMACDYWKKTRAPWESSEAFLFGPAAYLSLDPLLDSWPLDQNQLQQVLDGDQELTVDFVRDGLGAVLRGFHTVEFLLFREGENRKAEDVTTREKEYLSAVTEVLRDDCLKLWSAWNGIPADSPEAAILEAIEFEVAMPYGENFIKAGSVGSNYISQVSAIDEMFQGAIAIADEVGNAKIADPHNSGDVLDVESWFSWNSLLDFTNNIRSIENAYLGGYDANGRGANISDMVKAKNAALDTEMKEKIEGAKTAINAIPYPFRNHLKDPAVVIAMSKVNELKDVIEGKIKPLFVN